MDIGGGRPQPRRAFEQRRGLLVIALGSNQHAEQMKRVRDIRLLRQHRAIAAFRLAQPAGAVMSLAMVEKTCGRGLTVGRGQDRVSGMDCDKSCEAAPRPPGCGAAGDPNHTPSGKRRLTFCCGASAADSVQVMPLI